MSVSMVKKILVLSSVAVLGAATAVAGELPKLSKSVNASVDETRYQYKVVEAQIRASKMSIDMITCGVDCLEVEPVFYAKNGHEIAVDDVLVEAIRQTMSETLRDPYSADYASVKANATHDEFLIAACGQVNAKNAYGAYVGFQPFVVLFTNPHSGSKIEPIVEIGEKWIAESCISMGLG